MRVFVAMSGGVDSSVAAALLVEAGHDVTGVTMQLLPEGDAPGQCCGDDAIRSARRVCDVLGVPHYTLNMREVFSAHVIEPFVRSYSQGMTPNPCIACNDRVKFSVLLARVRTLGADALATGHYARIVRNGTGSARLARGADAGKDQSYFLYRLVSPAIDSVIFPVGEMHKEQVRTKAAAWGLPTAERADSQEICFVPTSGVPAFVGARVTDALAAGPIVDQHGAVRGSHRGIARYTVGQRKGLGIASPEPLYVTAIDAASHTVHVGPRALLEQRLVVATDAVWGLDEDVDREGIPVTVQTRYRMAPVSAVATFTPACPRGGDGVDTLRVELDMPVAGVAPGQAVVCYRGDTVVGGGVASKTR